MAELPYAANTKENNEGLGDYSPMAPGDVIASINKSGYKETKAKTGNYLQLIWKVLSPKKYKGRVLFDNLNLDNPNPIAVEIANKALNSICQACDKVGVKDSEELHGIPCKLTLGIQEATATNPPSNSIKSYSKVEGDVAVDKDDSPQEAPSGETGQKRKKLPWEK